MSYTYSYPRPALTTDILVFSVNTGKTEIVLIQRKNFPFEGLWALPGGFVEMEETLEECAVRELCEETGLKNIPLTQFYTFGNPGRDPRGRTISVVYLGFVNPASVSVIAGDDAANVRWFPVNGLPELAFDHAEIIAKALEKIAAQR